MIFENLVFEPNIFRFHIVFFFFRFQILISNYFSIFGSFFSSIFVNFSCFRNLKIFDSRIKISKIKNFRYFFTTVALRSNSSDYQKKYRTRGAPEQIKKYHGGPAVLSLICRLQESRYPSPSSVRAPTCNMACEKTCQRP